MAKELVGQKPAPVSSAFQTDHPTRKTVLNQEAENLLELQEVDYLLLELEHSKSYLPEMIAVKEKEISTLEGDLKSKKEELTAKTLETKRLELEISKTQGDLSDLQKKMSVIKTNKEYDALSKEIDVRKASVSQAEEQVLNLMGETDELKKEIERLKEKLGTVKKHSEAELEGLKKEMEVIGSKVRDKMEERKLRAAKIHRQTLSIYERVRKGRGGQPVVRVSESRQACSGCFKTLPPQRIQELKRQDQVITCQNCGRILIWVEGD